jgi:signal transduction histidine kinase
MSFRRKLLLVFALTVFIAVAAVAWIVSAFTRRAFERSNEDRTLALIKQFQREFSRRGDDIVRRVEAIASSDSVTHMALAVSRSAPDYGAYLSEARSLADNQQLDFLELLDSQGAIISSAQSPAKFGYKTSGFNPAQPVPKAAYLKQEELPEGSVLGLFATRAVTVADKPLYVLGGRHLDKDFLASLELPSGMRALLYQNLAPAFSPLLLIDPSGTLQQPEKLLPIIQEVQQQGGEPTETIHWSSDPADDETIHAIPLRGQDNQLLGVLLVGNSRRTYVELERRIGYVALLVGGGGILLAVVLSTWAAGRVTRPVVQLAQAAREVAGGNWDARVDVSTSTSELGDLAEAFNRMIRELSEQRERLVQTERVAAWRELARRLAHELKNPLFPLQLTVENLLRARQKSPDLFEEIFRESSSTLLAEISNLKEIIGRFSEFSKMPQPRFQKVDLNEVVQGAMRLFQAQLQSPGRPGITCKLSLDEHLPTIAADADLLHRAISNLVLNAMDAMPQGGTLTLRSGQQDEHVRLEVSDTGTGLTPEECERLFTPYYTSKQHGTGLGLAIVQSVISDHRGRISVESTPGHGTTFKIELPYNLDKLTAAGSESLSAPAGVTP